jgi:hypothetical protein
MNKITAFFTKNWHTLAAVVVLAIVVYLIYAAGKKANQQPNIISDTGTGPTQADIDKSNALAQRLKDDLSGINFGHDDTIYNELIQSSNVVFALTLSKYKALTGASLIADINSDYFYGWDVIDNIIAKANQLNLT